MAQAQMLCSVFRRVLASSMQLANWQAAIGVLPWGEPPCLKNTQYSRCVLQICLLRWEFGRLGWFR